MLLQLSMVLIYNDDITNGLNLFQGKLNRMSTLFHENQDIQISFLIGHPLLKDDYKKLINNHERPTNMHSKCTGLRECLFVFLHGAVKA
jgi:hypothetical protein